jgi:hypothetical protein
VARSRPLPSCSFLVVRFAFGSHDDDRWTSSFSVFIASNSTSAPGAAVSSAQQNLQRRRAECDGKNDDSYPPSQHLFGPQQNNQAHASLPATSAALYVSQATTSFTGASPAGFNGPVRGGHFPCLPAPINNSHSLLVLQCTAPTRNRQWGCV